MKKAIFTSMLLLAMHTTDAQQDGNVCTSTLSQIDLHGNSIRARILNGGDLFWDGNSGLFIPNAAEGALDVATIFSANLWIGGTDVAGNLKVAANTFRLATGKTDFFAGPLNSEGLTDANSCENWDRFFRVVGSSVAGFLADLPELSNNLNTAISEYRSIMGWPGRGNPYFASIWGFDLPNQSLAPFHDADGDEFYDPLKGDYPVVELQNGTQLVPAEFIWCVFNDQGAGAEHANTHATPLHVEVQQMAWAFNCIDQPVLNRTIFISHKIINKSLEVIDACFAGIWVDFDLGCPDDDYFGSAPSLDAFFAYNQDAIDGSVGGNCFPGIPTFADTAPVQSVVFLGSSLDKFMYYNDSWNNPPAATREPNLPIEYYNYLTGHWKDGAPLTFGGNGYGGTVPTDHALSGNPANVNDWTMCKAKLPTYRRKVLGSHKLGKLLPGQSADLLTAWAVHPDPDLPCGLGSTYNEIAELRASFSENFADVCSQLTNVPEVHDIEIKIFPSPAANVVTLQYGGLPIREIRLFAADGKLIKSLQNIQPEQTVLDVAGLNNGVYTLQLLTEKGSAARKISVVW
jgi:hypothetical protein